MKRKTPPQSLSEDEVSSHSLASSPPTQTIDIVPIQLRKKQKKQYDEMKQKLKDEKAAKLKLERENRRLVDELKQQNISRDKALAAVKQQLKEIEETNKMLQAQQTTSAPQPAAASISMPQEPSTPSAASTSIPQPAQQPMSYFPMNFNMNAASMQRSFFNNNKLLSLNNKLPWIELMLKL